MPFDGVLYGGAEIFFRRRRLFMMLNEFVGNDTVKYELSKAMASEAFPHALIIEGAKGTGKKTLAGIIASYCVCLSDEDKPCGRCAGCVKALHKCHPDIFVIDGTQPGALSIENVRKIRSDAFIMPNEAPKKAYLILDCDKMLAPAQNALLKILEEPPLNVVFVLTVSSANILLQTVRSRSRIYTLYPPDKEEAAAYLEKRYPEINPGELNNHAALCGGNIGAAITGIEGGGEEAAALAEEMLHAVVKRRSYDLLLLTTRLSSSREFAAKSIDMLLGLSGEAIRASAGLDVTSEAAKAASEKLTLERLYKLADNIEKAREVLKSNVNLNFFGTWLCAQLLG